MNLRIKPSSKVLLIEPPFYRFFGYERWHYPLTLTLIATYLREAGHKVLVYDADRPDSGCRSLSRTEVINDYHRYAEALETPHHPIWQEVFQTVEDYQPDVVGLTSISAKIDSANLIARRLKECRKDSLTIILGGPHAQGMSLAQSDYDFGSFYDQVVTHIPGIIDRKPDKNLILGVDAYSASNLSSIMTSTGCPNSCTFCCHSFEKTTSYRSIGSVREELRELHERFKGSAPVYVVDDCFFSNQRHFRAVIAVLKEMGFSFTAGARLMALSPERLEAFRQHGGNRILVGVESGSQRVLDRIKKRLRVEEIENRTRWLNESGIPWSAFIVVGFPFETIDDLKQTEELIHRIQPTFVSINRFTPYPGTELYREYCANKHVQFKDLFQLNNRRCVECSEEMEEYITHLFVTFDEYNRRMKARSR